MHIAVVIDKACGRSPTEVALAVLRLIDHYGHHAGADVYV